MITYLGYIHDHLLMLADFLGIHNVGPSTCDEENLYNRLIDYLSSNYPDFMGNFVLRDIEVTNEMNNMEHFGKASMYTYGGYGVKSASHFIQNTRGQEERVFNKYDYGEEENLLR